MIFWLIAGCMAAVVVALVTAPIRATHPRLSWALTLAFPLLGLVLYSFLGSPNLIR